MTDAPRRLTLPDTAAPSEDGLRFAPSAARNAGPIAAVLDRMLPRQGRMLELAAGTGQHAVAFAARYSGLDWQPTDLDTANLETIAARVARAGLASLRPPVALNACAPGWAARHGPVDAVLLVNLLHLISDAEAACSLSEIAAALAPGGVACIYGPFRRDGLLTTDGDRAFDAQLRAQDPAIGYKDAGAVAGQLTRAGLGVAQIEMPAGNLMLVARRGPAAA
jgi:SAM-dependent methyltransferase